MKGDPLAEEPSQGVAGQFRLSRRQSERIVIKIPATIELEDPSQAPELKDKAISGVTMNISSGGLLMEDGSEMGSGGVLIMTDHELPLGLQTIISMEIPLPGLVSRCRVSAETLRCSTSEEYQGKFNIAFRFKEIIFHQFNQAKYERLQHMMGLDESN